MTAAQKIAGFVAGLAVVFAAALGIGALVGPVGGTATSQTHEHDH